MHEQDFSILEGKALTLPELGLVHAWRFSPLYIIVLNDKCYIYDIGLFYSIYIYQLKYPKFLSIKPD
jgi:hypothetical protein